jgi:non-ribosomal peptide synthetase component E (peptide arylation enzyme)
MNERVEHLMLEHLRAIRADMPSMKEEMSGMRSEMIVMRQHMAGLLGAQALHDGGIAGLKARIDRIERRLDLVE